MRTGSSRVVADTWYAAELDGARRLDQVLARLPAPLGRLVGAMGPLRGCALFLSGRRADVIVTTNSAPGATTCMVLCGLLGTRRLVLLEYIVHPPAPGSRWRWPRTVFFVLLRRFLLGRALLLAHVFSGTEQVSHPSWHNMPAHQFVLVPWPGRSDDTPLPPLRSGRRVLASGRRTDWETFFAAAAGADWQVRAVCTGADLRKVRRLARGTGAVIQHDITAAAHQAEVDAATVYVIAVPDTGASIGQIRMMNATQGGAPVVASDVVGLREYVDANSAVLVPPGDAAALRKAVDGLLADPRRQQALRRAARARGETMAEYLNGIRALVATAAEDVAGGNLP